MNTYIETENNNYQERYELASCRIQELLTEEINLPKGSDFIKSCLSFLSLILDTKKLMDNRKLENLSLEELQKINQGLYEEILPKNYAESYGNPDYASRKLGKDFGPYLCAIYSELRSCIVHVFEGRLFYLTVIFELFLEIYQSLQDPDLTEENLHDILYYYCFDYSDVTVADRTRALLDPTMSFAVDIIMNSDLSDLRYLYSFGEYISDNELKTAKYLNTLSQEEINAMASTYTEGYRKGFEAYNIDLSEKRIVNIRYTLGFERVVKSAIRQFEAMGLQTVIYRAGATITHRSPRGKIGYFGGSANKQYDYDHRMDDALIFDKAYGMRRLSEQRIAYESMKQLATEYAGPAVIETFGELPFTPEEKSTIPEDSPKQKKQRIEYQSKAGLLTNEFIPGDKVSFTIIAYPVPEIGQDFEAIFHETIKVNTLDQTIYLKIQEKIINALDSGEYVTITGRGTNKTNITVALTPMTNPEKQTRFENCLADVNIPLGEVFTSPRLTGTTGTLHVTKSFLNGLKYENLQLEFMDGVVSDYSCSNFDSEEENQKYMEKNLLFGHKTLPMGEFAIGTNTTAYAMGKKYQISHLLPILIEEKTGPHFAIGDTCFSHEEELRTYNPDGKEMIAKENDFSKLRESEPTKAYFNCHTDITIPYHELGDIYVHQAEGSKLYILQNGRFVLPGTELLNEPLDA